MQRITGGPRMGRRSFPSTMKLRGGTIWLWWTLMRSSTAACTATMKMKSSSGILSVTGTIVRCPCIKQLISRTNQPIICRNFCCTVWLYINDKPEKLPNIWFVRCPLPTSVKTGGRCWRIICNTYKCWYQSKCWPCIRSAQIINCSNSKAYDSVCNSTIIRMSTGFRSRTNIFRTSAWQFATISEIQFLLQALFSIVERQSIHLWTPCKFVNEMRSL